MCYNTHRTRYRRIRLLRGECVRVRSLYLILLSILFFCMIIVMFSAFSNSADPTSAALGSNVQVIVDAGHGGEDGGAVAGDIYEKDINLKIAQKLSAYLQKAGFHVTQVRTEDISVYDEGIESISEKKTSDLHNRLELFNSDLDNIVISIHQNRFTDSRYSGTQVFYSPNNEDSEKLAEAIRASVVSALQPDNTRECKAADESIFVMNGAKVPAVLVECGFMSNTEELSKLTDERYQSQLAKCIYKGFMEYYNGRNQNG